LSNPIEAQVVEPSGTPGETITIKPQQIVLEGLSRKFKRRFQGWELWSPSDRYDVPAVYLTVQRSVVYWDPLADPDLQIYDSLDDFLDGQSDWLDDAERGQHDKWAIMRAYADLTDEELIENLDI
jgi:hypothetical protein